jgi:molybdopterin-containing oxidoreductase family molybdopterin binding subunit
MCLVACQVLVRVEDGRVVNVIGNPDSPRNRGRMCAKGKSGIMNHYNLNRVTGPLRRTNPDKGIGVDPGWVPITWDEAIEVVADGLRKVIADDPRMLYLQTWADQDFAPWLGALVPVVGTPYHQTGISGTCGKTIHSIQYLTAGGWWDEVDFEYCNYLIDVGTQQGVATREGFNHSVPDCATARVERNMKLVVVDPIGNNAAAKADEWLPIRPGTDAAFGMAMLHVLLNEARLFDAPYLARMTNAPYLVGADGRYVREPGTGKPQVHDTADGRIKAFDDPTVGDPSLEGSYMLDGQPVTPSFQLLKDRVAECPPEVAAGITTIPADRLRRIAREFGEAARIGATITIDGVELAYRPVALNWCRGPQGHKHAWHHSWALQLVNVVVGCINVPGGYQSRSTVIAWPHASWPAVGADGMMVPGGHSGKHATAFPGRTPTAPQRIDLFELFPAAAHTRTFVPEAARDTAKYGLDHRIRMLIHTAGNQVTGGWGNVDAVVDWYRSIDLVVGFAIEINETHELDDIVLPLPTSLETGSFDAQEAVCGEGVAFHTIQQPVVAPPPGVRQPMDVMQEVYDRVGILDDVLLVMNRLLKLRPPHLLEPGRCYTLEEVLDRQARSEYGEGHGWDWFSEHGLLVWQRGVEERYPGRFIAGRIPVYMENFIDRRDELRAVLGELGLDWDLTDYDPLPKWLACDAYGQLERGEIDAIGVHYKLPYVYGGQGNANPWIDELCEKLPHSYGALVNSQLARKRGICDDDWVWLESPTGRSRLRAHVTECVHPEVIGIAGHAGHWAKGKPLSRGKGVNFNTLLPYGPEHMDTISSSIDMCAPLTIRRADGVQP